MNHKKNLLITILIACSLNGSSQVQECYTDEYYQNQINSGSNFNSTINSFNSNLQVFRSSSQALSDQIIYIPTVFHIVYNGISATNISDAQVRDGLLVLNSAFANQNNHINGINCNLQFCLAKADNNNLPITGISRHYDSRSLYITPTDDSSLKLYGVLPSDKYLNIWIVPEIQGLDDNGNIVTGVKGYSTRPEALGSYPLLDGVVIKYDKLGTIGAGASQSPASLGKTLPHEVGHWLGLFHTFQITSGSCVESDCSVEGDRICDTPPVQSTAYSQTSMVTPTSCSSRKDCNFNIISAENYMEYNYDLCRNFFTAGQKERMRYTCHFYRNYFWNYSINNPSFFPIECSPVTTSTVGGGAADDCGVRKKPDEYFSVNGETGSELFLCNNTPITINKKYKGICTSLPSNWVPVPCSEDVYGCGWLQQLLGICDCGQNKTQFWLSISYYCDDNFNCPLESGKWFTYYDYSSVPMNMDVFSMLNFSASSTNTLRFSVKLAGLYGGVWKEGIKHITYLSNDLIITGNPSQNEKAVNSITFQNANVPDNSNYTASSYIKISPETKVDQGKNALFYISPVICKSNTARIGNPDSTSDSNQNSNNEIRQYLTNVTEESKLINNISSKELKIAPNPSNNGLFNVLLKSDSKIFIKIYNSLNVFIKEIEGSVIDIGAYSPGMYYAVITNEAKIYYEKLIYVD